MDQDIAIKVEGVSKTFKIPHEKITSVRGAFVNVFKRKRYEKFNALDNVSFEVKKGEFFGIIGRNGSGKSTLLKILAGIYQADTGKVHINGLISPFLELGIGFNPELSGRDNIYLNATVLGLTQKQIDEKFDEIVAFSELEKFIDQKIKNYSSGMQVRLAFSVAIHARREILLMDEVLAVGDMNFQQKCIDEFEKYKKIGKTVVLVSHGMEIIEKHCDRAVLLNSGKVVSVGASHKVSADYRNQNALDEEERIITKQNKKNIEKKNTREQKQKIVEITGVKFMDKNRKNKNVFRTGDDIVARIFYKVNKKIEKPVFGVAVYAQNGTAITGPNTKTSNFNIESLEGEGHIDFCIENNPFFTGMYDFTAGIYDWTCLKAFDRKDRLYSFRVFSREGNPYGIIEIKHKWK